MKMDVHFSLSIVIQLIIKYQRMSPEERVEQAGLTLLGQIEQSKQALIRNKYFENKDVLESNNPVYVDRDTKSILPTGHYFTEKGKEYKESGLFQIIKINPSSREVWIKQVSRKKDGTTFRANQIGEVTKLNYKDFKEAFKNGLS